MDIPRPRAPPARHGRHPRHHTGAAANHRADYLHWCSSLKMGCPVACPTNLKDPPSGRRSALWRQQCESRRSGKDRTTAATASRPASKFDDANVTFAQQ